MFIFEGPSFAPLLWGGVVSCVMFRNAELAVKTDSLWMAMVHVYTQCCCCLSLSFGVAPDLSALQ